LDEPRLRFEERDQHVRLFAVLIPRHTDTIGADMRPPPRRTYAIDVPELISDEPNQGASHPVTANVHSHPGVSSLAFSGVIGAACARVLTPGAGSPQLR